ncbi:MAG: restriction endonuclease subunit S [Lewinellaceae bacterium]|nr:restriction endonuclease subunit S [Lewinellaceae bacterium]HRW98985.1 restriction endonuclease subunit S [Cyclobacteriaceae bacterium]
MREDWIEIELKDACGIHDNLRKPINSSERNKRIQGKQKSELYPYYGATGQVGYIDDYLTDGEYVLIGEDGAPFLDYTKNVAYLINGKTWVNNHAHILRSYFNNRFLLYYLNTVNFNGFVSGTTRLKLTQASLKKIPIKLAPLSEQRAIVAKIEQLFSELDNGIANLKAAKDKLEIYRQAVLKKAFEGELTKEWREKSKNWEVGSLERLANIIDPQPSHRTPPKSDDGVPYIGVADFDKVSGKINFESARKVGKYVLEEHIERYRLNEGDFVIGKIGTIGKPFFVPVRRFYTLSANVVLIQPIKKIADSKYLFYLVLSPIIEEQFKKGSKATTQAAFGIKKVRLLNIPICSMEEQVSIVQEIESRLSVCDNIIVDIDEGLEKAEALRQSILKQAFEGKLLSETELQACRKESDWEPAEKLLSRIELEKEKL